MLAKNLFSVVLIASSVFAAPPAASPKDSAEHQGVFHKIRNALGHLKSLVPDHDIKSHIPSLLKNPHIHGCAKFKRNDCINWVHSIKDNQKDISIVKKIVGIFHKNAVSDKNEAEIVLKKVEDVQKQYPESESKGVTAGLTRRDEDLTPLVVILGIEIVGSIIALLGLAALFIVTVGHFIGFAPAAVIVAISAAIFKHEVLH